MISDLSYILIFWSALLLIGLVFLPTTFSLFKNFIDRGYIFSKVLGIFLTSFLLWYLSGFKILPFERLSIILILTLFAIFNLFLFKQNQNKLKGNEFSFKLIIFEEIIFLVTLLFWSFVRGNEPSIRGLEKFMDFGFVNSILRGQHFPPLDMWLAYSPSYSEGAHINYYYFGHYVTAFLTKITGIDSAVVYNLAIAVLFAFTFTLSFSLGMNLYYLSFKRSDLLRGRTSLKIILVGLLAAFLVALGGNLHPLYVFTEGYPNEAPVAPWRLELAFHPERYWYPNATRFIAYTIHEFPIYSFVVADLHGHVSDIPFVLLALAILLSLIASTKSNFVEKRGWTQLNKLLYQFEEQTSIPLIKVVLLGLLLALLYMTNAWDGLIYLILAILVFLYLNIKNTALPVTTRLYKTFSASLFLFFFFLLGSLPFSINFKPFISGIGVLCAPSFLLGKKIGPFLFEADKCQKSPIYQLIILWGFFYFNVVGFLFFTVISRIKATYFKIRQIPQSPRIKARINSNKLFAFIGVPIRIIRELSPVDIFIMIMIFISTLLLIFPEFFYVKDIYPAHYRANTMFKLGYQAFMMLGLSSAYIFFRIKDQYRASRDKLYFGYNFMFIFLFTFVAIYPYFAIKSYYGELKNYRGLDGLSWLANQYPDDYQGIVWLRENINCIGVPSVYCNNQPVIVEANGESYTDYARVSANTGLPTIIGWPVHEWLWRGSYDEAGRRIPEVAAIYESEDMVKTREILRKYNVEYIFLGALEREKYPNLKEDKFDELAEVVFQSGETRIYKVNLY